MRYLLDSNVLITLLRGRSGRLAGRVASHAVTEIGTSALVAHELYYGAYKSHDPEGGAEAVSALPFGVLEFEHRDARTSGEVRAALARTGETIGLIDTLIAGQALARGLVLVTHNVREFGRVPGLRLEDWEG